MALTRLLVVALLSVSTARAVAAVALVGNDVPCNVTAGDCPCGSAPPTWPPFGAAGWCPYGCLDAAGAPDTTGDLAVDVNGVCASAAFAAWRAPATHDALAVAGCPLSVAPLVSLRFFKPCVNITALLPGSANGSISCTPCALPPRPSPPPSVPPPSPPPDSPLGAVEVVETTLCLAGVDEDVALEAVITAIAALLGVSASDVSVAVTGALVGGCASVTRRFLQLAASPPPAPLPPASVEMPVVTLAAPTAVSIVVTTRASSSPSPADVAAAFQQLSGSSAAALAFVDAMQRSGEPRVTAVRLSSGGVAITAAPLPPAAPPPVAPAVAPAALKTGARLLPLRIVIAAVIGVAFCCVAPGFLLAIAAWNAAVHVIIVLGVRGTWLDGAMVDVSLSEKGVPQTALDCAAASMQSVCVSFFGARMDTRHVRSIDVRGLQPAEAALHAPLLWRSRGKKPAAGADPVDGDDVEAVFAVTVVFRSPVVAWKWRAAVDACADGRALTRELIQDLAAAAPCVSNLRASLALLRPAPRDDVKRAASGGEGGGDPLAMPAPLQRRTTLFVTSHPLRK